METDSIVIASPVTSQENSDARRLGVREAPKHVNLQALVHALLLTAVGASFVEFHFYPDAA